MTAYHDGEYIDQERIGSLLEPGFLYGWGAFETVRVYRARLIDVEMHLARLRKGLDLLSLPYPGETDLSQLARSLIGRNNLDDGYVRLSVYKKQQGVGVLAVAEECDYYPPQLYKTGARVMWAAFRRFSGDPFIHVKTMSYAKNRCAWQRARDAGYDEAVFCSENNFVQEGTRSNIFFLKSRQVYTPALQNGVLDGVTRRTVIALCRKMGTRVAEGNLTPGDVMSADEVFLTSSLADVLPVSVVGDRKLPVERYRFVYELLDAYREHMGKIE